MSLSASRPALRRLVLRNNTGGGSIAFRLTQRRLESSTTTAAKEAASKATSAATKSLSAVTSAAGPAIGRAAQGLSSALGRVGGRTGRLISFVERQVPFVVYYSKVGLELGKLIFKGQKMVPPPLATFQSYGTYLLSMIRNPSAALPKGVTLSSYTQQLRGMSNTQLAAGGVILAECLGFFTVGEMLGRFKIVGYHGEPAHH